MLITKSIPIRTAVVWFRRGILLILAFVVLIAILYEFQLIRFSLPVLPVTLLGTAVAFYLGFKNNNSYDRMWEARKIWGALVNSSRAFANSVDGYISNYFTDEPLSDNEIHQIKTRLIHRHIGWLYQLRRQLLVPTSWEHLSQNNVEGKIAFRAVKNYGIGLYEKEAAEVPLSKFVSQEEYDLMETMKNPCTQLINQQSKDLQKLREIGLIEDFRHVEIMDLLNEFYDEQGKMERIKKFPLPRQYAFGARVFNYLFIILLPFTLMPAIYETMTPGIGAISLSIGLTSLVVWVYYMMDMLGDYSENPFSGGATDIPMLSLSRVIEIDLRQMLGETDIPPAIEEKKGILM